MLGIAGSNVGAQEDRRQVGADSGVAEAWQNMHEGGLISDEEYQHALQYGRLPGGVDAEAAEGIQAAPEARRDPKLARRELSYAVRWEQALTRLDAFSRRMRDKYAPKREEARERAKALGIPIRWDLPGGGVAGLDYFDDQGFLQVNQTDNAVSADTISTDEVWPSGGNDFYLTGSPIILGIWEYGGAVRATHQEFGSRVDQRDDALSVYGVSDHATGVAGTMAAAGLYPPARGMSYAASVHAYDSDDYLSELPQSATNGVRISIHSYGWRRGWYWKQSESTWYWYGNPWISQVEDYKFGLYDGEAQERDEFVYSSLYCLPVWSAGNDRDDGPATQPVLHKIRPPCWDDSTAIRYVDGYDNGFDTIASRKTAKNILTVGAVDDIVGGYSQPSDVEMASFSGFGPTDDGRIKPDVVANGIDLTSPHGQSDSSYGLSWSGTSFAAPSVAGSLGLLQQLHEQLHGTNEPLWGSTYKGLVIHSADEAGGSAGPDYRFGWGLMNTFAAAQLMTGNAAYNSKPHIKEVTLPDGEEVLFHVMGDGSVPLRVTICWSDPPGPLPPAQLDPPNLVLVNDLDLRVIDPNETTHFPWVLDPSNPASAATTGDNFRDNVEQVHIENAIPGAYTVIISHKGVLTNGAQDVSIVLSGNLAQDMDFQLTEVGVTSGMIRLEWTSAVGSIHRVMSSTNLLDPDGWTALSDDISIIAETTEWVDEGSASEQLRFYRIEEIK